MYVRDINARSTESKVLTNFTNVKVLNLIYLQWVLFVILWIYKHTVEGACVYSTDNVYEVEAVVYW